MPAGRGRPRRGNLALPQPRDTARARAPDRGLNVSWFGLLVGAPHEGAAGIAKFGMRPRRVAAGLIFLFPALWRPSAAIANATVGAIAGNARWPSIIFTSVPGA